MFFRSSLAVRALSALALGLPALALPQGAPAYDYVVVGSGPGGGVVASNLALAGHSVLLIEAGRDDSDDIKTTVPALEHPRTDSLQWSFFARHYADDDSNLRFRLLTWLLPDGSYWVGKGADAPDGAVLKGVWYPRGSTLGGSAIVNAAASVLPNDADWDEMAALAGDDSWSHGPMRKVFERIEKNYHLPADTPGHGFDGWMEIDQGASSYYSQSPGRLALLDTLAQSLVGDVGGKEALLRYLERDANFEGPSRDDAAEPYGLPAHKPDGRRWSPRDLIHATVNSTSRLQLQLESLATRILFDDDDDDKSGAAPRAVGVEFLEGAGVYQGTWKYNATTAPKGTTKRAYARKEVIVSGGVFNSPQLLQLSGIGNATHLRSLGIAVVADLAGVGLNMRDNQELPVAGRSPVNITLTQDDPLWPSCTRGAPGDPCLELWYEGKGPYRGPPGNSECSFFRSDHSPNGKRDVLTFGPPGVLRGFAPPTGQTDLGLFTDSPDTLWRSIARMSPQNNAGYVRIASSDPTALPDINLNHYAAGGDVDVGAMMDTVAWVRRGFAALPAPYGPILETIEPPCPSGYDPKTGVCSVPDEDAQWIREQTFGHHAVGTCKMGTEDDALAVVDAKFRVFGVQGLRVVDGSVFPIAPGAFPVLPTVMLGQKASDTILEDA